MSKGDFEPDISEVTFQRSSLNNSSYSHKQNTIPSTFQKEGKINVEVR